MKSLTDQVKDLSGVIDELKDTVSSEANILKIIEAMRLEFTE